MIVKVAVAQMNSIVGDLAGNARLILDFAEEAAAQGADILVTPECSLVGYPPEDLLLRSAFLSQTELALQTLAQQLGQWPDLHALVGHPHSQDGQRFNAVSRLHGGHVQQTYLKHSLPNDAVFDEKRYFSSGQEAQVFDVKGCRFGINICEDTWHDDAPRLARAAGAQVLLAPNASPFHANKLDLRIDVMRKHVCQQGMSLVLANVVGGQDELVFDGNSFVLDANGVVQAQLPHCETALRVIDFIDGIPQTSVIEKPLALEAQIYRALVLGVRDYVTKNGFPSVLIGFSGGVDSALTLAIAVD
ncbi:MAG: NAD+ synthase, partial [Burkholderiales bacterium]|nr:NAD+ synthase [Burkholderiales bacterium]